ncbi:hypothetical protein CHUAL_008792 [Chamberlinius hualienensis]
MTSVSQLSTSDYISLTLSVAITLIPGVYISFRRQKNNSLIEFLMVNRKINFLIIILSGSATIISPVGIVGVTTEGYKNGMSFMPYTLSVLILMPFGAYLFIPVYYKLNKNSIYEYLEMRFNFITRICASFITGIQMIFITATILYAPAVTISQVTGLNTWIIIVITSTLSVVYTAVGGFKAVVWSDSCQFVVMSGSLLLLLVRGLIKVGGINVVWDRAVAGERSQFFVLSESPNSAYTFWVLTTGTAIQYVGYLVLNQSMMQRFLSNATLKKAQLSMAGIMIAIGVVTAIQIFLGMVIYAYYYDCDPLLNKQIKKSDQLMAMYSIDILSFFNGLSGIFIGGLLCATISTVSSYLNSLAILTISDFVTLLKPNIPEKTLLRLSKFTVLMYGCICTALIAWIERQSGIVELFFSILSLTCSPVMTLITSGMLLPWVNVKGAIAGFFVSMILPWWSWIGKMLSSIPINHAPYSIEGCTNSSMAANSTLVFYNKIMEKNLLLHFYSVNPLWYPLWAFVVGILVSIVVSKFTGFEDIKKLNPDLFFPFVRKYVIKQNSKFDANKNQNDREMTHLEVTACRSLLNNGN